MNNNGNQNQLLLVKTCRDVARCVPTFLANGYSPQQTIQCFTIRLKKQEQTFVGSALVLSWRDWLITQRLFSLLCLPF